MAAAPVAPDTGLLLLKPRVWLTPVIFILVIVLIAQNIANEDTLRVQAGRANAARLSLKTLFSTLQDAEIAQRGYLLTGNPAFRKTYDAARVEVGRQEATTAALLLAGRGPPIEISGLRRHVAERFDLLSGAIVVRDTQGPSAAAALVSSERGERLMEEIHADADALASEEWRRLMARRERRLGARRLTSVLGGGVLLAAMGIVVSAQWRDARNARQRIRLVRQLRDQVVRTEAIFDSAMDAILTLDPGGAIESINRAAERMFGFVRDDLLLHDLSIIIDVGSRRFSGFIERVRAGDPELQAGVLRELTGRRKDGSSFPVDVALRGMPLPDGLHVVAIVRDISERRRVEAMKEEFVATVSHELRTPLTSIAGALGLLKGGAGGMLPDRAVRLVQIAETNSARLVRLINDILDMEKFASGEASFAFSSQSFNDLAQRAVDMMGGLAEDRGVSMVVHPARDDPRVWADPDRVLQILVNLLSNGLKFAPSGSTLDVRVSAALGHARLSIEDHGPGVPAAFRDRLFQKFAQADGSDARGHGGTGLGLAISHEIAELHGGALCHTPTPGGGATFHLDLLFAGPSAPTSESARPRLLICEDDVLTADHLRHELAAMGCDVDVTGGANEARQALHIRRYAAMLLDLGLPDADGLTLLRTLRSAPATRDLPIIVVSEAIDRLGDERLPDVIDWIHKPVDLARLNAALRKALDRRPSALPMILHVDDDADLLEVARGMLGASGEIVPARSLAEARRILRERRPDVVVMDLGLPDGSGAELIPDLVDVQGRPIPVIVYTATDSHGLQEAQDAQVVSVFTKSRVGLQSVAAAVRRAAHPEVGARGRG